jgi:hypothetical protein
MPSEAQQDMHVRVHGGQKENRTREGLQDEIIFFHLYISFRAYPNRKEVSYMSCAAEKDKKSDEAQKPETKKGSEKDCGCGCLPPLKSK